MKKVLIVGVRSDFSHQLKRDYKGKIKFSFLKDQDRIVGKKSGNYDVVICLLKFASHNSERAYGNQANYIRIGDGQGQGQIRPILDKLLEQV